MLKRRQTRTTQGSDIFGESSSWGKKRRGGRNPEVGRRYRLRLPKALTSGIILKSALAQKNRCLRCPPLLNKGRRVPDRRGGWLINTLSPEISCGCNDNSYSQGSTGPFSLRCWVPRIGGGKVEAEHPVPGLDQLCVSLEMQRSTQFDVSASREEEYVEETDMATFIQSMLIVSSLEPRGASLSDRRTEVISVNETVSTPQATAIAKGKGIYVAPPKKTPINKA